MEENIKQTAANVSGISMIVLGAQQMAAGNNWGVALIACGMILDYIRHNRLKY